MDSKRPVEALPGASNTKTLQKTPKTLLVHPFTPGNPQNNLNPETSDKPKNYLLETPKDLKRRQPLLELPGEFSKKPKLYKKYEINNDSEMKSSQSDESVVKIADDQNNSTDNKSLKKCHCCCNCSGESDKSCHQPVKVIIAPAMMPSIFGPVPGIPYIVQQGKVDKVSAIWIVKLSSHNCVRFKLCHSTTIFVENHRVRRRHGTTQ